MNNRLYALSVQIGILNVRPTVVNTHGGFCFLSSICEQQRAVEDLHKWCLRAFITVGRRLLRLSVVAIMSLQTHMKEMVRPIFSWLEKHLPVIKFLLIVPVAVFSYSFAKGIDSSSLSVYFAILLSFIAWMYARQGMEPEEKRILVWHEFFVFVVCGAIPGIMVWLFLTTYW